MKAVLILLVAVAVVVLRLWRRRRHPTRSRSLTGIAWRPLRGDVALIAGREVRERVRGRILRIGTLVILAVVAAVIVVPVIDSGKPSPQQLGVVGALSAPQRQAVLSAARSSGTRVHLVAETDLPAARGALRSGQLDAVIVDGQELVVDKAIAPTDTSTRAQFVEALAKILGVIEAYEAAHLSATQASALAGAKAIPVMSLQPSAPKGASHSTTLVGVILIFVMLTQYNTWILIGVMEEKSSRVVEVLLAAVRPVQLLGGKVLGIGMVAFAQAGLVVVFALVLAKAVGSSLLHGTAPLVLACIMVWLVLGYAFYCWVYAAAGSLAERQDQVQSLALPLSLPIIVAYVLSLTVAGTGNPSTFFYVLAYLPPTAPFAMPVLVGLGRITWWEFALSAGLTIVCTVFVARLAAGIYRRAILRTGRRVQLREVLSAHATR